MASPTLPANAHVIACTKFGGTSVASPERIRRVVELVTATAAEGRTVVVVSALGGTTDDLLAALDAALARSGHTDAVDAIRQRHEAAADDLATADDRPALQVVLDVFGQARFLCRLFRRFARLLLGKEKAEASTKSKGRSKDKSKGKGKCKGKGQQRQSKGKAKGKAKAK